MYKRFFVSGFAVISISSLLGCATTADSLRSPTAGVLGYPPESVTISDVRSETSSTYYVAKTPKGQFACSAESGVQKIMQLGLTNPPTCKKK